MWLEIKKIFMRRQYWITIIILMGAVIVDYLATCKAYYGTPLSQVRSAYRCIIIKNDISNIMSVFFTILLPILACVMCSDVYYEEYKLGITNVLYTRKNRKINLHHKLVSVMVVTFLSFFIPLLINLLLAVLAFPVQGSYSSNTTYLTLVKPDSGRVLSYLEAFHPYLNILCFILIRCLIASLIAAFSYSLSLICTSNRYFVLLSGFVYYVVYINTVNIIPNEILNTNIMGVNTYGSIWAVIIFVSFTVMFIYLCLKLGERKETL